MDLVKYVVSALLLFTPIVSADQKIKLEDLPPAVRRTVQAQTKNVTTVGLSKEVENGKTMYEVETKVNGKSRDLLLDETGAVVEVEEEADIATIPAPARAAIEKGAAGGIIGKVEAVTHGSTVSYEAAIATKAGRNFEVSVNGDGSPHK